MEWGKGDFKPPSPPSSKVAGDCGAGVQFSHPNPAQAQADTALAVGRRLSLFLVPPSTTDQRSPQFPAEALAFLG